MSLYEEISELIDLKTEGDYWDFKVQWHENKADLLHDIICMANNLANRDAYLIIADHQHDTSFSVSDLEIKYHTTLIYSEKVIYLDGYRTLIPFPQTSTVRLNHEMSLTYLFFDRDSINGKLFNCLNRL